MGEPRRIPLTQGRFALVDEVDYLRFGGSRWCLAGRYARRSRPGGGPALSLHHEIMGTPAEGCVVDHINGDPLDNRRANLRFCTRAENGRNRRTRGGLSGFKGVVYVRATGKYRAYILAEGVSHRSACFHTAIAAALAYDAMAREFHGEFAALNFPDHVVPFEWRPHTQERAQPRYRELRKAGAAA